VKFAGIIADGLHCGMSASTGNWHDYPLFTWLENDPVHSGLDAVAVDPRLMAVGQRTGEA
jgi:hypothetical protein